MHFFHPTYLYILLFPNTTMKFKKRFSQKGQIGAPLELLVAVIIMAFVIIISSKLLYDTNRNVCKSSVDKEISSLKGMLEDTAKRDSTNKFTFYVENACFDITRASTYVEKKVTKNECIANCGQPVDSCWVLKFDSKEKTDGIFVQTCLEVPIYTRFFTKDECELEIGYSAVNPRERIPFGQYLIRNNIASAYIETDDAINVCMLYKE